MDHAAWVESAPLTTLTRDRNIELKLTFIFFIFVDNFFMDTNVYACLLLWSTNAIYRISIKNSFTYPKHIQIHFLMGTLIVTAWVVCIIIINWLVTLHDIKQRTKRTWIGCKTGLDGVSRRLQPPSWKSDRIHAKLGRVSVEVGCSASENRNLKRLFFDRKVVHVSQF